MKVNEAVYRSPKWLRNLVDYEVSTGEDIKGEPSKKMKDKLAKEKAEKDRIERERKEEKRRQEEYNKRRKEEDDDKKDKDEFRIIFIDLMEFLNGHYDHKGVVDSVYRIDDEIIVEFTAIHPTYKRVEIVVGLLFESKITTFKVHVKCENGKEWNYSVSGLLYIKYVTTINGIVKWWRISGKSFDEKSGGQAGSKMDPDQNRKRRLNLLKTTLEGYERQLARTPEGVEKDQLKNEISNIKGRIKAMEQPRNERFNHLLSYQLFEKRFDPFKDDYVTISYDQTGDPVPVRIIKRYPNNTYEVSFDVEGSVARGAPNKTIRNSDIISPYKPIRSPVGSGFISSNTNFQVRNTTNVNQVSNDMYL